MNTATLEDTLHAGVTALGLNLSAEQEQKLLAYVALIAKWNKVYNLTAVREPEAMVTQHLLDSLAVLPHLGAAKSLVDVGAGAGLPGIPLAIARPDLQVTLSDSNHKKTTFMQQACVELGLTNAKVVCERVERVQLPEKADAVISRAADAAGVEVATIANAPGTAGSFRVYAHLAQQYGAINAEAAAEGLAIFAEHTEDASTHPGRHPNIDRLIAILTTGIPLNARVI